MLTIFRSSIEFHVEKLERQLVGIRARAQRLRTLPTPVPPEAEPPAVPVFSAEPPAEPQYTAAQAVIEANKLEHYKIALETTITGLERAKKVGRRFGRDPTAVKNTTQAAWAAMSALEGALQS